MSDTRVSLSADDFITLLVHAKKVGTVDNWCCAATDWMQQADKIIAQQTNEIKLLKKQLQGKES